MSNSRDQEYESPHKINYKARQFSTADKYTNVEVTVEKLNQLQDQVHFLKQCLQKHGINPDKESAQQTGTTDRLIQHRNKGSLDQIQKWNLERRNQYLLQKVKKLKIQRDREVEAIYRIKNSQKWRNKNKCGPDACYKNRYLKLLRIRCPDTEY